ncbi:hypothetical protein FQZ97_1271830 [compost metagenome]
MQDHAQVPHCPAVAGVDELHGGQTDADRNFSLPPSFTRVIGKQHNAALADSYKPFASTSNRKQNGFRRLMTQHRAFV